MKRFSLDFKPIIKGLLVGCIVAAPVLAIKGYDAMLTPAEREQRIVEQRESAAQRERDHHAAIERCTADRECRLSVYKDIALDACRKKVELSATYDFRWIDAWHERKFMLAGWRGDTRIAVYQGDLVEFQLQQGSWARHTYQCDFDIDTQNATVTVARGRRAAS